MKLAPVAALAALAVVAATGTSLADIRSEYIANIKDVEEKIITLAKATPEKKFTWRPAKGVRSISEVYMHVVGANYVLPSFCGVKPPEGISPEMEKSVTAKAKVVEYLEASYAHLRKAIEETPEADLDKVVKTFIGDISERAVYLLAVSHGHEHLGQSIAYARVNGVTPPWTAAQDAKGKQKASAE